MNYKDLQKPLEIKDVDFRVQSINNGGYATILAYKDARVDMRRLDDALGIENWQRDVKIVDGVLYGGVGIYNKELNQWVWKWDAGTESNTEKEKGRASDAFKRACFNLGIGRELYDYPIISIKLEASEIQDKGGKKYASWGFKLKEWKWLSQFTDGVLTFLAAQDTSGKTRFKWGAFDKNREVEETSKNVGEKVDELKDESPTTEPNEEGNASGVLKPKAEPIEKEPNEDEEKAEMALYMKNKLVAEYEKLFGRKPHGKASIETIQVKIDEKLAEVGTEEKPTVVVEDPYSGETKEVKPEEVEAEEVEAEEVDLGMHGGPIADFANKIDTFTDREALKEWAIKSIHKISEMPDVLTEHKDDFKEAVNNMYEKLS